MDMDNVITPLTDGQKNMTYGTQQKGLEYGRF